MKIRHGQATRRWTAQEDWEQSTLWSGERRAVAATGKRDERCPASWPGRRRGRGSGPTRDLTAGERPPAEMDQF